MEIELKSQFVKLNKDKADLAKKLEKLNQKNNSRNHRQAQKNLKRTYFPKFKTSKADLADTKVLEDLDRKNYKQKIEKMKNQLLQEENKKCTFQPNVNKNFNKKAVEDSNIPIYEKLYKNEKKKNKKNESKEEENVSQNPKKKVNLKIYENQKSWKDNINKKLEIAKRKKLAESYIPYEKKKNNTKFLLLNKPSKFLDRVVYDSNIAEIKKKKLKKKLDNFKFKPKLNYNRGVKSVVSETLKKKFVTQY